MHTYENNAIRYLMKEMDPSEEMEFEKEMREDENLLIEVESLRASNKKLSDLPFKNPPEKLTKAITQQAVQTRSRTKSSTSHITFFIKRGIAAAILLSAFTGGYVYYSGYAETQPESTVTDTDTVEPWVDRNEILKFSEGEQVDQSSTIQADLNRSYQKLQLVNDPTSGNSSGNSILLTGSSN
jgi:hypothetical protein